MHIRMINTRFQKISHNVLFTRMKPSEVLARHKAMQDVKFREAPPR